MDRRGLAAGALVAAGAVALLLLSLSLTVQDPGVGPGDEGGRGGGDTGGEGGGTQLGAGSGDGGGGGGELAIPCVTWPLGLAAALVALGAGWGITAALLPKGRRLVVPGLVGAALGVLAFFLVVSAAEGLCEPRTYAQDGAGEVASPPDAPLDAPAGGSGGGTPQLPPLDPKLLVVLLVLVLLVVLVALLLARARRGRGNEAAPDAPDGGAAGGGAARGAPLPLRAQDAREVVAAYVAACASLDAAGHPRAAWETAGEYARRAPPGARDAMLQLTRLYESVRHGEAAAGPEANARARALAQAVERAAAPEVVEVG